MPILFNICLWCDLGGDDMARKLGRLMDRLMWLDHETGGKGVPISWALTGQTIEALGRVSPSTLEAIRWRTTSKDHYAWDKAEIVTSTFHSSLLVQPSVHDDRVQDSYVNHFVREDVRRTNKALHEYLDRTPRGFCPSEKVFNVFSSHVLSSEGYDYVIIGGEHFGSDSHGQGNKGQVFETRASHLKVLVTANEVNPSNFARYPTAESYVDDIIAYAHRNKLGRVLTACDVDFFLNNVDEGFERLKWIYYKTRGQGETIRFVNSGALVDSAFQSGYHAPLCLEEFYLSRGITDPIRFASSWVNAEGNLEYINHKRGEDARTYLEAWENKRANGGNWDALNRSLDVWLNIAHTVFYDNRPEWLNFMPEHYNENLAKAWDRLHEA